MSDNQCSSDPNIRQSFDERVCDDLSEEILRYLPFEDQLRLRCVSKQFQRTLFSEKLETIVNPYVEMDKTTHKLQEYPRAKDFEHYFVSNSDQYIERYNYFIEILFKSWPKLSHFALNVYNMNEENLQKFRIKFASDLVSAELYSNISLNKFFDTIEVSNVKNLHLESFCSKLSDIQFNKIKRLVIRDLYYQDLEDFKAFAERNANNVKHLKFIQFQANISQLEEKESFKCLLNIITKFNKLIELEFRYSSKVFLYYLNDKSFTNDFNRFAIQCNQLKSFEIWWFIDLTNGQTIDTMFKPLKQFRQLKRLCLGLTNKHIYGTEFNENLSLFSFKAFEGFQNLTHLRIYFDLCFFETNTYINETFLTAIDTNLPNLQFLGIYIPMISSEWTADILSRLSILEFIELYIDDPGIGFYIKAKLIEKCKRIKIIKI